MTTPEHAVTTPSEAPSGLHPRITELLCELDSVRAELREVLASIPENVLHAPPAGDTWSVAQILEHLAIVEDGSGRVVSKIARELDGAQESETGSILGVNDHYAHRIATSTERIIAPENVRPSGSLSIDDALAMLETTRVHVKAALTKASGLALGQRTFPHPLFGAFSGYQWAVAIAQHERRHIAQIRRLLSHVGA